MDLQLMHEGGSFRHLASLVPLYATPEITIIFYSGTPALDWLYGFPHSGIAALMSGYPKSLEDVHCQMMTEFRSLEAFRGCVASIRPRSRT